MHGYLAVRRSYNSLNTSATDTEFDKGHSGLPTPIGRSDRHSAVL
jgi:hypothetical protein